MKEVLKKKTYGAIYLRIMNKKIFDTYKRQKKMLIFGGGLGGVKTSTSTLS
jgi:hypothetical protein